jgi:hypothetical protein
LYYELSYQTANSSPKPGYGNLYVVEGVNKTIKIKGLNISSGQTYVFYIRAICSVNSKSKWSSAKTVTISPYCNGVSNINFTDNTLTWDGEYYYNTNYQVQYGEAGFSLGRGTSLYTTNEYSYDFNMDYDKSYDFYIRAYCGTSATWSSWVGPYTHLNLQNACNLPSNLSRKIESISGSTANVSLQWSYNGGSNFEYIVVPHGSSITNATIYSASTSGWPVMSLNRNYTYDFYMRTVCSNGSKTAWTMPYLISNL